MKKKILCLLMILILPVLCLCGCSNAIKTKNDDVQGNSFVCVEQCMGSGDYYYIFVNRNTRVMYFFFGSGYKGGLTVMLNADGTPMLWEGEL